MQEAKKKKLVFTTAPRMWAHDPPPFRDTSVSSTESGAISFLLHVCSPFFILRLITFTEFFFPVILRRPRGPRTDGYARAPTIGLGGVCLKRLTWARGVWKQAEEGNYLHAYEINV